MFFLQIILDVTVWELCKFKLVTVWRRYREINIAVLYGTTRCIMSTTQCIMSNMWHCTSAAWCQLVNSYIKIKIFEIQLFPAVYFGQCRFDKLQWCFDISKISVRYRIACRNIKIFDIPISTFWYIILLNFHMWCEEVVKFPLKLSLNFLSWENFVKFYITTYLSEFQKAVISCRDNCLSLIS